MKQFKKNLLEFILTLGIITILSIITYYYGYTEPNKTNQPSETGNETIQEGTKQDIKKKEFSNISKFYIK